MKASPTRTKSCASGRTEATGRQEGGGGGKSALGRLIRRSRSAPLRALVLVLVHVAIAAHIAHWMTAGRTLAPLEPSEGIQFSVAGELNAGMIFFLALIVLTLVFGRFFCGWACHIVALQDLSSWLLSKIGIRPRPFHSRLLAFVPFIAFVYMFLWPFVQRWQRGLGWKFEGVHLYKEAFWETFPTWPIALLTFFVCGFVIVYVLGGKGFCTYGCPYGGIFGVVDRFAPWRIRVTDACEGCGHCTAVCSSNVIVHKEVHEHRMVVDPGCMKCLDCVSVCPNDALYVGVGKPPGLRAPATASSARPRPDFTWGEELLMAGTFLLSLYSFRGLYGLIPFLLSLGISAILAFFSVQTWRLLRRPYLRLQRWTLKSSGSLRPAGIVYCAGFGLFALFWAHSGWVQYHVKALKDFEPRLHALQMDALRPEAVVLGDEDRSAVAAALEHARAVERFALTDRIVDDERTAWLQLLAGDPAPLRAWLTARLDEQPDSRRHFTRALLRLKAGEVEEGRADLERAVELEPTYVEAWLRLALTHVEAGALGEASAVYERALSAAGRDPRLLFDYGVLLSQRGGLTGQAGRLAESQQLFEAARARFAEAVELDPRDLRARENLAGILCQLGRFREGIEHFRTALAQRPADAGSWLLLARAHLSLQPPEVSQARAALEEGLRHVRGDCGLLGLLAEICRSQGDQRAFDAALAALRAAGC